MAVNSDLLKSDPQRAKLVKALKRCSTLWDKDLRTGIKGYKRSLILSSTYSYVARKIFFKNKVNAMAISVLQMEIKKGVLRVFPWRPSSTDPWHIVRKTDFPETHVNGWRLVVDMVCNNFVTPGGYPLKSPENVASSTSKYRFFWRTDATTAYGQFKWATPQDEAHTCIFTELGVLSHPGMPQGLRGSQEFLMRSFSKIFSSLAPPPSIYVDNFGGGGDTIEECFSHFFRFVELCQLNNVKLNHGDTEIGASIVTTLRYEI
jgi:hypothetical protein